MSSSYDKRADTGLSRLTGFSLVMPTWVRDLLDWLGPVEITKHRLQQWQRDDNQQS
jgi:hypothetical protein